MTVILHSACPMPKGRRGRPSRDPQGEGIYRKHKTILIADDDRTTRLLVSMIAKKAGYGWKTASNGRDALEIYREGGVDLVISDRQMPLMDGLELLRKLRSFDPDVKVIILSGGMSDEHRSEFLQAGAVMVLDKPYDNKDLVCVIEATI